MKTNGLTTVAVREYDSPTVTIVQAVSEGILCESVNGILDLDYIYDEDDKE